VKMAAAGVPATGATGAPASRRGQQAESRLRFADLSFMATLGVFWLPWSLAPVVINITYLSYCCFFIGTVALLFEYQIHDRPVSLIGVGLCVYLVILGLYGFFAGAELWLVGADVAVLLALAVGTIWAAKRSFEDVVQILRICWRLAYTLLICNVIIICLLRGTLDITQGGVEDKNLVAVPIWWSSAFICSISPLLYAASARQRDRTPSGAKDFAQLQKLCWSTVLASVGVGFMTGERTSIVIAGLTGLVLVRLSLRTGLGKEAAILLFSVCSVMILIAVVSFSGFEGSIFDPLEETYLIQKFKHKEIKEDSRYEELIYLVDSLQGRELVGMGLGVTFDVFWSGTEDPYRPTRKMHLGGFCFLQKGGLLLFTGLVVFPGILAIRYMMAPTRKDIVKLACWGGVLIYLVPSLGATGGWEHDATFLYGIWLSMALQSGRMSLSQRLQLRNEGVERL
jgi:hypothetical protein